MRSRLSLRLALVGTALLAPLAGSHADDTEELLNSMRDLNAVQSVYRAAVPHTDRNGNLLTRYDPERSFLQIGVWGSPFGEIYGHNYDLSMLADAGFNTIWPWYGRGLAAELEAAVQAGLQVVHMGALDPADAAAHRDHPSWLGNVWHDEPTGGFWGKDMEGKFAEFLDYKQQINAAAPGRPVFINDVPWITPPATSWWVKWNTGGDVACHDNYPILHRKARTRTLGDSESVTGIPTSAAFAAAVNREEKPVWVIVGAFTVRGHGAFPFRFATPQQLRGQVYAALTHGATGIIYFCWDTYVCRDGDVIGMSPDPQVAYLEPGPGKPKASPARPMQLAESKALWMAAEQINSELRELTPSLLSPTVGDEVKYSLKIEGEAVSDAPVRCLLKPHPDGGYVLLTVNLDDAVLNVTYELEGGLTAVEPLFENRPALELQEGTRSFQELYEPFDVHVYHING
ncbi:MAG: hypothetical protein FJX74_10950 [Armatimonadetes bacterium]|nr:hypothetical protein [Armatimonadota bacterium]